MSANIVHEQNKDTLLKKACDELAILEEYYSVWIGIAKKRYIYEMASAGIKIGKIKN